MGTMIQATNPTLEEFEGYEGCNEILNVTRPDLIAEIHRKYLAVGVDAIETNTFGANLANLAEYGIPERIYELAFAGAKVARETADEFEGQRWVLGSMGPGTKLPTLGHVTYEELRDTYREAARGLIDGGSDALLIETTQDLLQAKAAVNGARRAIEGANRDILLIAQVTVETTGTMLLGSEIGAALNALSNLEIDLIGMNCATGPAEMSEHLRQLSQTSKLGISCMPNAGLPVLKDGGAYYPLEPDAFAEALSTYVDQYGLNLIGGCCGTTPEHLASLVKRIEGRSLPKNSAKIEAGASSLYQFVPFRQDQTYLAIGERANANV
jgi:5-methyltetrahydrofolate--homocysteine methyltransferase